MPEQPEDVEEETVSIITLATTAAEIEVGLVPKPYSIEERDENLCEEDESENLSHHKHDAFETNT